MTQAHVIENLEFDIRFRSEPTAFEQQSRLSSLLKGPAMEIIEEVFNGLCSADEVLCLERLELDLGAIPKSELESCFGMRLRERLETALKDKLLRAAQDNAGREAVLQTREQAELQAFTHFLSSGHFSWRRALQSALSMSELSDRVLRHSARELAQWLRSMPQRYDVVHRMVGQCSDAWLGGFVQSLTAGRGHEGALIVARWVELHREAGLGGTQAWRDALWETLFVEAMRRDGAMGSTASASSTRGAASGVASVDELAKLMMSAAVSAIGGGSSAVPALRAAASGGSPRRATSDVAGQAVSKAVEAALKFSESGCGTDESARLRMTVQASLADDASAPWSAETQSAWQALIRSDPEWVRVVLHRLGGSVRVRRRIARGAAHSVLRGLVSVLAPGREAIFIDASRPHVEPAMRAESAGAGGVDSLENEMAAEPRSTPFRLRYRSLNDPLTLRYRRDGLRYRSLNDPFALRYRRVKLKYRSLLQMQPGAPTASECDLWEFTLAYLLQENATGLTTRSYVESLLHRMAARAGLDVQELAAQALSAFERRGQEDCGSEVHEALNAIRELSERPGRPQVAPIQSATSKTSPAFQNPSALTQQIPWLVQPDAITLESSAPSPSARRFSTAAASSSRLRDQFTASLVTAALAPWTAATEHVWRELIRLDPDFIRSELRRAGASAHTRRHLAGRASPSLLRDLVQLFAPTHVALVHAVVHRGFTVSESSLDQAPWQESSSSEPTQPFTHDASATGRTLWEFTLAHLFMECPSSFDAVAYVHSVIHRWARHQSRNADELVHAAMTQLRQHRQLVEVERQLLNALSAWRGTHSVASDVRGGFGEDSADWAQTEQLTTADPRGPEIGATTEKVDENLSSTSMPIDDCSVLQSRFEAVISDDAAGLSEVITETTWNKLIQHDCKWLTAVLRGTSNAAGVSHRIVRDLSRPMLMRIVELLAPQHHEFITAATGAAITGAFAQASSRSVTDVERTLWDIALQELLQSSGSGFDERAFFATLSHHAQTTWHMDDAGFTREWRVHMAGHEGTTDVVHREVLHVPMSGGETAGRPTARTLIENALQPGHSFAWSANLERAWRHHLHHDAAWLRHQLRRAAASTSARRTLIEGLSRAMLLDAVQLIEPAEYPFMESAIVAMLQAASDITDGPPSRQLERRLWDASLDHLLQASGAFHEREYLECLLRTAAVEMRRGPQSIAQAAIEQVACISGADAHQRRLLKLLMASGGAAVSGAGKSAATKLSRPRPDRQGPPSLAGRTVRPGTDGSDAIEHDSVRAIRRAGAKRSPLALRLGRAGLRYRRLLAHEVPPFDTSGRTGGMLRGQVADQRPERRQSGLQQAERQWPRHQWPEHQPPDPDRIAAERVASHHDAFTDLLHHIDGTALQARSEWPRLLRTAGQLPSELAAPARAQWASALEHPRAADRLVELLPPHLISRFIQRLRPAQHGSLQHCIDAVSGAIDSDAATQPASAQPAQIGQRYALRYLFEEDRLFTPADFCHRLAGEFVNELKPNQPADWLAAAARKLPATTRPADAALMDEIAKALTRTQEAFLTASAPTERTVWLMDTAPGHEPIYIINAGLVLLAPYLQRLLAMLDFLRDGTFVDQAAAERAMQVMQFLVDGQPQSPEHVLVLNKLLCGVPIEAPIVRQTDLSEREQQAGEGLLKAVIGHWKAIGKTSVAGLRESFLQREGRLVHSDVGWQLKVEPKTFDMLIDQLPWGFSTVKFPWMEEVIHVDWR